MIIIEGNGWGNNYNGFPGPWESNLVISFPQILESEHPGGDSALSGFARKHRLPLWLGESGENKNEWFRDCTELVERNHIGWSWWPHKKVGSESCVLTVRRPDDFKTVVDFWNKGGPAPAKEIARKALFELAEKP